MNSLKIVIQLMYCVSFRSFKSFQSIMGATKEQAATKKTFGKRRNVIPFKKKYHRQSIQAKAIPNKVNKSCAWPNTIQWTDAQSSDQSHSSLAREKCFPLDFSAETDPTAYFSDSSMLSNTAFKEMLSAVAAGAALDTDECSIAHLLNNQEVLAFSRQLAQLLTRENYLKLQVEQWTYYYHFGLIEGIWNGRVSKTMADVSSMLSHYGRTKAISEQRSTKYRQQLEAMEREIEHLKQTFILAINTNKLILAVNCLIERNQRRLRVEFERRRGMLKLDAQEHQYVQAFYHLKPRETEVCELIVHCCHAYLIEYVSCLDSLSKDYLESHS